MRFWWFRLIPFWLLVVLVCTAYVATDALVVWLPCQSELLIGFCELGKFIVISLGSILLAIYMILVYLIQRRGRTLNIPSEGKSGLLAPVVIGLIFLAIPVFFNFGILRRDPALRPYAQASLRQNGQKLVEFVSFSDVPRYVTQPGGKPGFIASGVIRVRESARYEIQPMRFKGETPTRVLSIEQESNAQAEWRDLQGGESYNFQYLVEIQAEQTGADCAPISWKVLWQVNSLPPFPLYLFGQGVFAQVYPDDSGEYAYVTHVNPAFQTSEYIVCLKNGP